MRIIKSNYRWRGFLTTDTNTLAHTHRQQTPETLDRRRRSTRNYSVGVNDRLAFGFCMSAWERQRRW